ncbi:protein-l-isoaspartate o-methyltransferase [Anaeramoeba flamelloides]|uniref:Protein-l-isoaspartate o-methyltransferase n=1 Tax=Anaeramoeba flamelloides TaxID=1746091 RepID=A0AAV7YRY0_9EUKA|nr:protein-l-isoaspartate o-methyltransferase [Anaeramoeba flamelloides]
MDNFKCPVCFSQYDSNHQPMILCQRNHTICIMCLENVTRCLICEEKIINPIYARDLQNLSIKTINRYTQMANLDKREYTFSSVAVDEWCLGDILEGEYQGAHKIRFLVCNGIIYDNNKGLVVKQIKGSINPLIGLKHKNICDIYGITNLNCISRTENKYLRDYKDDLSIVYQDYPKTRTLKELNIEQLNVNSRSKIALSVIKGLNYLHSKFIVHGWLNFSSVIISKSRIKENFQNIKLTQYGLSNLIHDQLGNWMTEEDPQNVDLGLLSFVAPEIFLGGHQIKHLSDIYSLSMLIYYLFIKSPFDSRGKVQNSLFNKKNRSNTMEFVSQILEGERPSCEESLMPNSLKELIARGLSGNPFERPKLQEFYQALKELVLEVTLKENEKDNKNENIEVQNIEETVSIESEEYEENNPDFENFFNLMESEIIGINSFQDNLSNQEYINFFGSSEEGDEEWISDNNSDISFDFDNGIQSESESNSDSERINEKQISQMGEIELKIDLNLDDEDELNNQLGEENQISIGFEKLTAKIEELSMADRSEQVSNQILPVSIFSLDWNADLDTLSTQKFRKQMIQDLRVVSVFKNVIHDHILNAMEIVPRHLFIETKTLGKWKNRSIIENEATKYSYKYYKPMPSTHKSNSSSPEIIGTELSFVKIIPGSRVLFIGAKGGYIQSVTAQIVGLNGLVVTLSSQKEVLSVLKKRCTKDCPYANQIFKWRHVDSILDTKPVMDLAPFDAILCGGYVSEIPSNFIDLLNEDGGTLIAPFQTNYNQYLTVVTRKQSTINTEVIQDWLVRFGKLI